MGRQVLQQGRGLCRGGTDMRRKIAFRIFVKTYFRTPPWVLSYDHKAYPFSCSHISELPSAHSAASVGDPVHEWDSNQTIFFLKAFKKEPNTQGWCPKVDDFGQGMWECSAVAGQDVRQGRGRALPWQKWVKGGELC